MMISREHQFLNLWTTSSICWISRRTPLQQRVPMISNTSQRWLPKTCGLFDTGFAGDAEQFTSSGPIAPADVLSEFDLGGHNSSVKFNDPTHLSLYDNIAESLNKDNQFESLTAVDEDNWGALDDLSADHLGDDSLDAFINLDNLLGNSFFDEDGNLVQDQEEVTPVINIPFIEDLNQNLAQVTQTSVEMVECPSQEVSPIVNESSVIPEKPSRKRKRKAKCDAIKTSLFEIPTVEAAASTTSLTTSVKNQSDHDYSSKRPKLTVVTPIVDVATLSSNISDDISSLPDVLLTDNCVTDSMIDMSSMSPLDKQSQRRIKNNVASKRSREQRKQKFVDMDSEAGELVIKNDALRKKIAELEKLAQEMKTALVAKMAGK